MLAKLSALAAALVACSLVHAAGPNILSNTIHAANNIAPAITAVLGSGVVDVSIFVDATNNVDNNGFLTPAAFVAAAQDTGRTNYRVATLTTDNHAPYGLITQSSTAWSLAIDEANYAALCGTVCPGGSITPVLYNYLMEYPSPVPSPLPVVTTTIEAPIGLNPDRGYGTEFTMTASYKGLDTSTPSNTAAAFAGFLAALQSTHPTFNWFDIKGAFRQTAGQWTTGWSFNNDGYGAIDYDAASALTTTSSLYLQGPLLVGSTTGVINQLSLTIYPFRQTRRHHEVVYLIPATYVWPVKNEYTTTDLTASGGTLIYTSNTTDVIPAATVSFSVPPGRYNLVGFTTDNLGNFSRHEVWSDTGVMGQCL